MRVDKKLQRKHRWERISRPEYNGWYKEVKEEEVLGYLRKGWGGEQVKENSKVEVRERDKGK